MYLYNFHTTKHAYDSFHPNLMIEDLYHAISVGILRKDFISITPKFGFYSPIIFSMDMVLSTSGMLW